MGAGARFQHPAGFGAAVRGPGRGQAEPNPPVVRSQAQGVGGPLKLLSARALHQQAAALIIAGGFGARFWPAARVNRPKPLFSMNGRTSLLDDTIERLMPVIARERIFVLVPSALEEV